MTIAASELHALIKAALPDARIVLEDLTGDGTHYAVSVVSNDFCGMTQINQQRVISAALGDHLGSDLHSVSLQTSVFDETHRTPFQAGQVTYQHCVDLAALRRGGKLADLPGFAPENTSLQMPPSFLGDRRVCSSSWCGVD